MNPIPTLRRALPVGLARIRAGRPRLEVVPAALGLILGLETLIGWVSSMPALVVMNRRWSPMVMSSAICLVLSAIALLSCGAGRARSIRLLAGWLVLGIAAASLAELVLGIGTAFDLPALHRLLQPDDPFPGRMTLNSAVGFMLLGLMIILMNLGTGLRHEAPVRWMCYALVMLGLFGVCHNVLHLEFLYGWTGAPMGMKTAFGLLLLAFSINTRLRKADASPGISPAEDVGEILRVSSLVLLAIALSVGLVTFSMLEKRIEQTVSDTLAQRLRDRQMLMNGLIDKGVDQVSLFSTSPVFIRALRVLDAHPSDQSARQLFDQAAQRLHQYGYSAVAFEPLSRRPDGAFEDVPIGVRLANREGFELVWRNGYRLRARLPMSDAQGIVGHFVAEQPLPALDQAVEELDRWGETGQLLMCWDEAVDLACFPHASNAPVAHISRLMNGQLRPVARALRGETGTRIAMDADGDRVLAAYAPLGESGLGMTVKVDLAELYAPLRIQFERFLLALAGIVVVGTVWMRQRLRPLAQALVAAKRRAEQSEARFLSAVGSAHHSFALLEAVRDEAGQLVDFRYAYLRDGEGVTSRLADRRVGEMLVRQFPDAMNNGVFDKYRQVVETGVAALFELRVTTPDSAGAWIENRVAKYGDGVAVATMDVTERRQDHDRIRTLAQRLSLALRAGHIGVYEYDSATGNVNADAFAQDLLGVLPGHPMTYEFLSGRVLPEDLPEAESRLRKVLDSGMAGRFQFRVVHPDRGIRHIEAFLERVVDSGEKPGRIVGVLQDVTERALAEEQVRQQARSDALTGLANRTSFFERLDHALAHAARSRHPLAVLFIDIDHFKVINDTHGHAAGDTVLKEVARRLSGSVRGYDTVARIGGDEFTLILEDVENLGAAQRLAAKMVTAMERPVEFGDRQISVRLSVGGAFLDAPRVSAEHLMATADAALYQVKKQGRNGSMVLCVSTGQADESSGESLSRPCGERQQV